MTSNPGYPEAKNR